MEDIGWSELEIRAALSRSFGRDVDRQAGRAVSTAGEHAGTTFGTRMGSKASSVLHHHFSQTAKYIVGPLVGAFAVEKVGELIGESISAAGSLEAAQARVRLIFGKSGEEVSHFGENAAKSYGLADLSVRNAASGFGILFKQAKLSREENARDSIQFTKLGADLAAFSHTDPEQAFVALQRGLAGATRGLKPYGILIDGAQQKAEALHLGLLKPVKDQAKIHSAQVAVLADQVAYNKAVADHGKASLAAQEAEAHLGTAQETLRKSVEGTVPALTAQQKVLANRALILQQTTTQQGQFSRSNDTLYGQQRKLTASFHDAEDRLGKGLLPVATDFVHTLNKDLVPAIDHASVWFQHKGAPAIHHFTHELTPLVESALPAVKTGLEDAYGAGKKLLPIVTGIFDAFNNLPGWAQKAVLIGGGAGLLAKKTGLLSLGTKALANGGLTGAASLAHPIPVLVVNKGFTGPGGVPTGTPGGGGGVASDIEGAAKKIPLGIKLGVAAGIVKLGAEDLSIFHRASVTPSPFDASTLQASRLGEAQGLQGLHVSGPDHKVAIDFDRLANSLHRYGDASKYAKKLQDELEHGGFNGSAGFFGTSDGAKAGGALHDLNEAIAAAGAGRQPLKATGTAIDALRANLGKTSAAYDLIGHSAGRFGRTVTGLPAKVETQILTPGLITSATDLDHLNRSYSLTPKQVRTEYELIGIDRARAQFDAFQGYMGRHTTFEQQIELTPHTPTPPPSGVHIDKVEVHANDHRDITSWAQRQAQKTALDGVRRGPR